MSVNHVSVTVNSGRNIGTGKNGKVDSFVAIQLGDKKFRTSIIPKSNSPTWNEECEFSFSNKYSILTLTVYSRTFFGFDEFLGQVRLPLDEVYELNTQSRSCWYPLKGKSGKKEEHKYAGELQISLTFSFKPNSVSPAPVESKPSNLIERHPSFLDLKNTVKSALSGRKKSPHRQKSDTVLIGIGDINRRVSDGFSPPKSLTVPQLVVQPPSDGAADAPSDTRHESRKISKSLPRASTIFGGRLSEYLEAKSENDNTQLRSAPQQRRNSNALRPGEHRLRSSSSAFDLTGSSDVFYDTMTKKDLIELVKSQRLELMKHDRRARELEDYIDQLVFRVINAEPSLLQGPFVRPPFNKLLAANDDE